MAQPHASPASDRWSDPIELIRRAGIGAFFRPVDLYSAGLTRDQLPALVRSGRVERVGRGLYRVARADPSEDYSLALVAARVPTSIVCLLSALRVHGIGTQAPPAVWIGIPQRARTPRVPEVRVRVVRFSGVAWRFGVKETRFEGVRACVTSPARTIVDCFRFQRLIGPEIPREALDDALRRRIVTIADLSRVESELPSRTLRAALDARSL